MSNPKHQSHIKLSFVRWLVQSSSTGKQHREDDYFYFL
jgi:hypothetical protein